ncbi:MAG: protein TolQ [Sphingomonadales bacterium]
MFEVSTDPTTMSPIALFLQADLVVKGVMILLLAASVWTWSIIVAASLRIGVATKESDAFERSFLKAEDVESFSRDHRDSEVPSARVFAAGLAEWRQSTKGKIDREGTRARLSSALAAGVAAEVDKLADRLNVLATVGSVAPFVGLFGTVWGIMRSFSGIAAAQNTSLAVVAPGIAEALFATALGLFAAIPAVIAYNRFSHRLNRLEARLGRFADGFHATLSRELDAL